MRCFFFTRKIVRFQQAIVVRFVFRNSLVCTNNLESVQLKVMDLTSINASIAIKMNDRTGARSVANGEMLHRIAEICYSLVVFQICTWSNVLPFNSTRIITRS